jgi:hypothetical protein
MSGILIWQLIGELEELTVRLMMEKDQSVMEIPIEYDRNLIDRENFSR